MIKLKNLEQIKLIRESSILTSKTLGILSKEIKPGSNSLYLDKLAEEFIRDNGGIPAFLGLYDYPNTICASINNQVVHCPPTSKPINEGDIISIDCGVLMNGYYGDQAYTFEVGETSSNIKKFIKRVKNSLYIGIKQCLKGNYIGDIGFEIQKYIENKGYSVVRELVGHGIGENIHEDPNVPNYGFRGKGVKLDNGMVLSIEPMVNLGSKEVKFDNDKWSVFTKDNKISAHFEHNIAIFNNKPYLLSTFKYIYDYLDTYSLEEEEDFYFNI